MGKLKYLAKNTLIFGISQFSSKVIVFLLLPLYTSYMSTAQYGTADLIVSTIGLLLPIFTVQMSSAVMRFAIEDKTKGKMYFSKGIRVIAIGFLILLLASPLLWKFNVFGEHLYLFYLLYITNAIYLLLSYYARAMDRIMLVGIVGVINTIIVVSCNVVMLAFLSKGVFGYLSSYILGYFVGILIFLFVMRREISVKRTQNSREVGKELTRYSLPLVPNSVSWWAVSSANKYIINGFISDSVLGLYSVALKIPTIINTFQEILAEALSLSVLKEYDSREKDERYFSMLYNTYNFSITFITCIVIFATKIVSSFFFAKEFFSAWVYVPLLCIPSVWGALSGYLGTFYSASKKNNGMFFSTVIGGIVNVLLSLVFIQLFDVFGVIVGNIISYFVIWLYRWIDVKKFVTLEAEMGKHIISWILLIVQAISVILIPNELMMYAMGLVFIGGHVLLNLKIVKMCCSMIKKILKLR